MNSYYRGVFKILILWVLIVNKIFIQHPKFFPTVLKYPKIAGANSLVFKWCHYISFHLQYCYGNSPIMDPITEMGVANPFELRQVKDPKCKHRGGGLVQRVLNR